MTTNLDRALGEIIKDGKKRGGGSGRGRGGGNRGRGGRGGVARRGGFRQRGTNSGRGGVASRGGVANGSGPVRRERGSFRAATSPYQRPPPTRVGVGLAAGSRIILTNLDPQLTEDDCLEIFQNVGPVSRAVIHYNRDGSSQGTAEVHFANKNDALRAVDEYDAAQIDGRPMYVKVIANKAPTVVQRAPAQAPQQSVPFPAFRGKPNAVPRTRGGSRSGRGGQDAARGGPVRRGSAPRGARGSRGANRGTRGRGGRGGRRNDKSVPTAESLDADLDQYHYGTTTDLIAAGQPANPAIVPKQ